MTTKGYEVFRSGRDYAGSRQPAWMAKVVVGSVIRSRVGTLRVVRRVIRYRCGALHGVELAIRRCSWTSRPTTYLNHVDLKTFGYTLVPRVRHKFATRLDRELQKCIAMPAAVTKRWRWKRSMPKGLKQLPRREGRLTLDCCDVHGLA